jgi:hypothetical protein
MKIIVAFITITITICSFRPAMAQIDSTLLKSPAPKDTLKHTLNMDAIYNRPFLQLGKSPISIGGYVESDWEKVSTSGISLGNQFQFRRFSLFVASTITSHIKFFRRSNMRTIPQAIPTDRPGRNSRSNMRRWTSSSTPV